MAVEVAPPPQVSPRHADYHITIKIPDPLRARMHAYSDSSGMPLAELVRRSVDAYLAGRGA